MLGNDPGAMRQARIDAYESAEAKEYWSSIDAIADRLGNDAATVLRRAKEGKSIIGEAGVDAAKGVLEAGFDAGLAAVTGGSALVPLAARVYGQSVGTARRAGATPEQQAAYGLTSAAIEVASEMLFDGVAKIYGAGAADDIVEKLVVELAESDTGRSMLRFLALAAGEGAEEVVSDLLSPLAEATYRDESLAELYRQLEPSELLYDYLIGAAISTLASGASTVAGQRADASPEYRANEAEYFNILERNGHLESKNAAHEGAAMQEQDDTARKSSYQENGGLHYDETKSIIKKGKVSGALTPGSIRAEQHAEQYYESVRHMTTDVKRIAENTGFSEQEILEIKSFIFEETHDLGYDEPIRFFPSYEMAQSWQRLIDGKNIKPHDITLLYHELLERQLMLEGLSQEEAHIKASKEFNYNTEADEYYGSLEKHPKD